MQDVLSIAQSYIEAGIKCIPTQTNDKRPCGGVRQWGTNFLTFEQFKSFANGSTPGIGIVTGKCSGIVCIDIDKKSGGLAWYEQNKDRLGNFIEEQTPGGGYHLYFRYPDNTEYLASDNHFAPGVEVKADGGRYVVTAPSGHPSGGHYKIWNDIPLTQVPFESDPPPAWLIQELLLKRSKRDKLLANPDLINSDPAKTGIKGDIPSAIEAVSRFPAAIQGEAGDTQTFAAAAICKEYGLTQKEALDVLTKHYNPRCKPMWDQAGLKQKILNAYKYAQAELGQKVMETAATIESYEALNAESWIKEPEVVATQILPGVFDKGDKVVIIGKSKTRKSFFAQQLAFCLAAGRSFLQFKAEKCKVLIIQSEIKKHRYHTRCLRMAERLEILPGELANLTVVNARGCPDLRALIKERVRAVKPDIVIIDPFYKLIDGDENKSEDIKPILKVFDALAEETGAAIVYVHHDKKGAIGDVDLNDRGSGSGLLARDFDSAIFLAAHETIEDGLVAEFITRNYSSPEKFTIEWMNYSFGVSDALPNKRTARSANRKAKLEDLVATAKKLIAGEYNFGSRTMGVSVFNKKLTELGIPKNCLMAVREELIRVQAIEIETHKAQQGRDSKVIVFIAPSEPGVIEELKDNEPWF